MATKKRGQLSTSGEWAKQLRPLLKRWFWKGERRAEINEVQAEINDADPPVQIASSVEELLLEVKSWPDGTEKAELWVSNELTLKNRPVANDSAMAIVVDAILAKGMMPAGKSQGEDGVLYFYEFS